jgi:arylsulfatase A-like enzyme
MTTRPPASAPARSQALSRLTGPVIVASLFGVACADQAREAGDGDAPAGVVLIVVDTLRADHLGTYGSPLGLTPALDGVADRGVVFEQAIAPSSWTRSTMASLFTSRYPSSLGVLGREDALAPAALTLAEVLRDAGRMQTLGVITNQNAGRPFGFDQGFDRFEVPELTAGYPHDAQIHIAEGVTRRALHLLDDRVSGLPFFLFMLYIDPHDPYLPHPDLVGEGPPGRFDGSRRQLAQLDRMPPGQRTANDLARIRHLYAGEVNYCDRWIGELLAGLEQRGLRDEVLLVVTADHGEGLWDHGHRAHGRHLYEELVRVPLILDPPGSAAEGRRVSQPVSLLDVAPTILAAFGIPPPKDYRGSDLAPLARGETSPARRPAVVYTELDVDDDDLEALRRGDTKLIRHRSSRGERGAPELYDLAADPDERHDQAAGHPVLLASMESALDRLSARVLAEATAAHRVALDSLDEESARGLRALGYLAGAPGQATKAPHEVDGSLARSLDFARPDHAEAQLLGGFHHLENGFRWVGGRSSARLGREQGATKWRVEGWVDLALHDREPLVVLVRAGEGAPQRTTLEQSGPFTLEGPLPPAAGPSVTLEIECEREVVPAAVGRGKDRRNLCLVVRSIGLY